MTKIGSHQLKHFLYLKGCVNTQACDFVLNKIISIG